MNRPLNLKVWHAAPTRSMRIVWALEELGLPYELQPFTFDRAYLKTPEWRAISPSGKVPVVHDDGKPLIESVAIIHYLSEKYAEGRLSRRPADPDYGAFLQWMHYGEAGLGPYGTMLLAHTKLLPPEHRVASVKEWAFNECKDACGFLETSLGTQPFILGEDFSLADISLGYMLHLIRLTGESKNLYGPKTMDYYRRLAERPAWKKAAA